VLQGIEVAQPWFYCRFEPTPAYGEVQPLFEEALALLNSQRIPEYRQVNERISDLGLAAQRRRMCDYIPVLSGH
jgi:hypothetical protein